jgi:hypothetical protein
MQLDSPSPYGQWLAIAEKHGVADEWEYRLVNETPYPCDPFEACARKALELCGVTEGVPE